MIRCAAVLTAALLAFVFLLPGQNGARAVDYYFLMLNGQQQPIDFETMPMKIEGRIYVAVNAFEKIGANCRYDGESYVLIVQNGAQKLNFDTKSGGAWDQNNTTYALSCVKRGSVYYVPAEFIANMLGYSYNFHSNYNFIRLASRREPYMDYEYVMPFIIENLWNDLVDRITESTEQNNPASTSPDATGDIPDLPPPPVVPERPGIPVYITFERVGAQDLPEILDMLGSKGLKALFFMTAGEMAEAGAGVNRIVAEGHSVGILVETDEPSVSMEEQLATANNLLKRLVKTKTRLCALAESYGMDERAMIQAAESAGFRVWNYNVLVTDAKSRGAFTDYAAVMQAMENPAVIRVNLENGAGPYLEDMLDHVLSGNYILKQINVATTPFI